MRTPKNIFFALLFLLQYSVLQVSASEYRNPTGKEFPILAWYSVLPKDATHQRYEELREAGFNLSTSDFKTLQDVLDALKLCRGTGVKLVVSCPEMNDERGTETIRVLSRKKDNAAYFLRDEPTPKDFPELRKLYEKIHNVDSSRPVYLDLYPTYVPLEALGTRDYREYMERSIQEVGTGFISFDHYPVLSQGMRPDYFENLEIARDLGRKYDQPFWAFVLANPHGDYPVPERSHMRLQAFCNLAYGAQALQYFTYWFALIRPDGGRSETFDLVTELNREVQNLAWVFLGAEVLNVSHTGDSIPQGTQPIGSLPGKIRSVSSNGEGLLVSHLRNGKKDFLMVVNRSRFHRQLVTIELEDEVQRVLPSGKTCPASLYSKDLWLDSGDYLLYEWNNHI